MESSYVWSQVWHKRDGEETEQKISFWGTGSGGCSCFPRGSALNLKGSHLFFGRWRARGQKIRSSSHPLALDSAPYWLLAWSDPDGIFPCSLVHCTDRRGPEERNFPEPLRPWGEETTLNPAVAPFTLYPIFTGKGEDMKRGMRKIKYRLRVKCLEL